MSNSKLLQYWSHLKVNGRRILIGTGFSVFVFVGIPLVYQTKHNRQIMEDFYYNTIHYEPLQIYTSTLGYSFPIPKTKGQSLPVVQEKRRMVQKNNELAFELISMRSILKQNEDLLAIYKKRSSELNPLSTEEVEKEITAAKTSTK